MEIFITKNQFMEQYQVSLSKLNRAMKSGELKFVKLGSTVRFSRKNIEDYITRH